MLRLRHIHASVNRAQLVPSVLQLQPLLNSSESSAITATATAAAAYTAQASCQDPKSSSSSRSLLATLGTLAAASVAVLLYYSDADAGAQDDSSAPAKTSRWNIISTEAKKRVFFKYEKRIRELSSLEKIFDYFASQEKEGIKYMAPEDLLRSLVATYPPHGSSVIRGGSLPGERTPIAAASAAHCPIFKAIDLDGDQLVSFTEYLLLLALLSIPLREIATVFRLVDADGDGQLDAEELAGVVQLLQAKAGLNRSNPRTGRHSGHKAVDLDKPMGLFVHFFGPELSGTVQVDQVLQFLASLHKQLIVLEFAHYDTTGAGTIPLADAGAALVASCRVPDIDRLFDRVNSLPPALANTRISLADFEQLARIYSDPDVHHVVTALEFCAQLGRPMNPPEVDRLLTKAAGIRLTPELLQMMFWLFGDGEHLDWELLVEVLERRSLLPGHRGPSAGQAAAAAKSGVVSYIECVKRCSKPNGEEPME